jgi:UDPglucose 6-dehydrogenase
LIGEGSKAAGDAIEAVYQRFVPQAKCHRMSAESAEITKLAINCMITTKISFAYVCVCLFVPNEQVQ